MVFLIGNAVKEMSQRLRVVYIVERESREVHPPYLQIRTLPLRGERAFAKYTSRMFSNVLDVL
jgi:hypothetical protein